MTLSEKHRKQLRGLSDDVIRARGYRTVDSKAELAELGFAEFQRRVPCLLVPLYDSDGAVVLHQIRPDKPRLHEGKAIKYETPMGASLRIDVPPSARAGLSDARTPLWVTEGSKKADAAVGNGLCCVALLGVDAWRTRDVHDVRRPLPDWDSVTLRDRLVYVAYDSDVMTKASVERALIDLTVFLVGRGAHVRWVYLPEGDASPVDGKATKVGLDDYLVADHTAEDLLALARAPRLPYVRTNDRELRDVTASAIAALALVNNPRVCCASG